MKSNFLWAANLALILNGQVSFRNIKVRRIEPAR